MVEITVVRTGARRFVFALDWYDGYPSWAAGPDPAWGRCTFPFWPRVRPETVYLAPLRPFSCSPPVLTPQHRPGVPAANFHIILRDALPQSGTPTPSRPGRSGLSLHQAGVMAMLRGPQGRLPSARVAGFFSHLVPREAGACHPSLRSFFVLSGA